MSSSSSYSSVRRLPQFIHFGNGKGGKQNNNKSPNRSSNKAANAAHPPPSTPPPNTLLKTPSKGDAAASTITTPPQPRTQTESRHRIRGILKNPSYRFSGIRVKSSSLSLSPKKKAYVPPNKPSTPATVGMNESFDDECDGNDSISRSSSCGSSTVGSVSTFGTTSTEGIKNAIEKIINNSNQSSQQNTKTSSSSDENNSNKDTTLLLQSSSSFASIESSASTTSTTVSTTSGSITSKEKFQRCARIKHIEDLKEQIGNAKARKLVERKAYRREDKLLLRLARQLKTISKLSRENALNITILEESNQFCEECYNQTLKELEEFTSSRRTERLLSENETKLKEDREQRDRIIRVQNAELEAQKRNHQFKCQTLCESVLDANNDLNRMRALWQKHVGENDDDHDLFLQNEGRKDSKKRGGRKSSRVSSLLVRAVVVVFVITTTLFVVPSVTTGGNYKITEAWGGSRDGADLYVEQHDEQRRLLPPLHMIPNGIIRNDKTNIGLGFQAATPTTNINRKSTRVTNDEMLINTTKNNEATVSDSMEIAEDGLSFEEPAKNILSCNINIDSNIDGYSSNTEENSICHPSSTVEKVTTKPGGKGKRRFKPKEVISQLFRK